MNIKRMRSRHHRPSNGGGSSGGGSRNLNGQLPLNRNHVFDSSGPDVRVRGTAQQLFEKYLQLGRDATSSGDRVTAEAHFQHAEHYFRILNAMAQAAQQAQTERQERAPRMPRQPHAQQGEQEQPEDDSEEQGEKSSDIEPESLAG